MSTMGREKYRDEDDRQPPMCGGIVFNKFRPKVHEKKKQYPNQEDTLFKAFDQRPVMTDSRSATSSSASSDENPASPETSLLHGEKSRSKRGSGKLIPFKDFVHANTVNLSSLQNQEVLRSEFFMEEKSGKETTGMHESPAVEFDPNDVHQLRGQHIGTKSESRKSIQPERNLSIDSSFPYSPKPPKSPKTSNKEFASPVLLAQNAPIAHNPPPNSPFLESPTWNANTANQQQEAFEMISSQSIYYRNKLGDAQKSYRKLVKDQTDQAEVIDKLTLEKESFQAETLLLREEMKAIRQQLEIFQKLLTQQVPETMTSVHLQPEPQSTEGSPQLDAVTKEAAIAMPEVLERFPRDFPIASPTNTVEESEGKTTDPAQNYWKREWELSMEEIQQVDHNSTGNDTADLDDDNSDPFCGISRLSPVNTPVAPVAPVTPVTPVRGVDPPEVKGTSDHVRKNTPKVSKELVTKKAEPSGSEFANKTYSADNDYQDDIRYVQELMEKYHHQFILQEPSLSQDDLRTSVNALDEQEKVFEIENMSDVDREYSQRQEEMARLRAAFERGELDESIQDSPIDFEYPRQESREGETKQFVNTHMSSFQPSKHGIVIHPVPEHKHLDIGNLTSGEDFPAYPMPVFLRGMRLQEPTLPDPSEHRSTRRESRQDESYRSERSGTECQRDVSQHSNDTEYADQIEHSTSHHNALLWSQSRGNENTTTEEREPPPPQRVTSESSQLEKKSKSGRHVSLLDVMEGEEESSEQTLAEVRDPGRNGRRGATYKIKMCSGSSLRRYKASSSSSNDEATIPSNQESRGKAIPVQERKSLSRRLI